MEKCNPGQKRGGWIERNFIPILMALLFYFITLKSGQNGIYLFDGSIPTQFGYLIYNGRLCYRDILMPPIGPLTGYLSALAYLVWGINYMSQVHLAGVICAVGAGIMCALLKRTVGVLPAISSCFLMALSTLPIPGILFYNDFSLLIIGVFFCLGLVRCTEGDRPFLEYAMWITVALLFLVKMHFGVLFAGGLALFEFVLWLGRKDRWPCKRIVFCLLPMFIAGLLLFASSGFRLDCLMASFAKSAKPDCAFLVSFNFIETFDRSLFYCWAFSGILLLSSISIALASRKKSFRYWSMMTLVLIIWGILALLGCVSCYTWPSQFFILGAVATTFYAADDSREKSGSLVWSFAVVLFAGMLLVKIIAAGGFNLKTWDERSGGFEAKPIGPVRVTSGFFNEVRMRRHQADMTELVSNLSKAFPEKKIFFGPELGMFYPMTRRLPPCPWFLWEDRRTLDINMKDVLEQLRAENYDIMVFPMKPQTPPAYCAQAIKQLPFSLLIPKLGILLTCRTHDLAVQVQMLAIKRIPSEK